MGETLRNYQSCCHNYNKQDSALNGDKCEPRIFILQKLRSITLKEKKKGGGGGGGGGGEREKEKHKETAEGKK